MIPTNDFGRTRSLRGPAYNLTKPLPQQQNNSPSNVTLFLTNLRCLDLDLRKDWPGITALTFSTRDAQQNQKKRIQCVEWALYQLFAIWDPEGTQSKLQPFFPPLEPLQSLNLRAALYRSLDQAKKTGVLGRDAVLRKTMLDECKGDRLEEVLSAFSNAVLKKVVLESFTNANVPIAERLAMESISYADERSNLSTLIAAYRVSLRKAILERKEAHGRYKDFNELVEKKNMQIMRRHEQLKNTMANDERHQLISGKETLTVQREVKKNWTGNSDWLETIVHGDGRFEEAGVLSKEYSQVWRHVENGSIVSAEYGQKKALLDHLESRVQEQNRRLTKWQHFERTLSRHEAHGPPKTRNPNADNQKTALSLNEHQSLRLPRAPETRLCLKPRELLEEHGSLIDSLKVQLAKVGQPKARPIRQAHVHAITSQLIESEEAWGEEGSGDTTNEQTQLKSPTEEGDQLYSTSGSEADLPPPRPKNRTRKSGLLLTPSDTVQNTQQPQASPPPILFSPGTNPKDGEEVSTDVSKDERHAVVRTPPNLSHRTSTLGSSVTSFLPPQISETSQIASEIINTMLTTSPSPTKPRHILSLAERTRLSMSRASHAKRSQYEDFDDLPDVPALPPSRPVHATGNSDKADTERVLSSNDVPQSEKAKHEELIARTRLSMSNHAAVTKNAQLERRQSLKAAAKAKRMSYMPKTSETIIVEELPKTKEPESDTVELQDIMEDAGADLPTEENYESVFKSRPKVGLSPQLSPVKAWGAMGGVVDGLGSSSPVG